MKKISFVGAGPVGCLAAIHFKRAGFDVEIFESRPDIRSVAIPAGRSINLALSKRGIAAIEELDIGINLLANAVPMYSRMIHSPNSSTVMSPYGIDESYFINSISRAELNRELLNYAIEKEKITVHFSHRITGVDLQTNTLNAEVQGLDQTVLQHKTFTFSHLISTDGSSSVVRDLVIKKNQGSSHVTPLDYAYKELTIPAGPNNTFQMEKTVLHIWPRGRFMLIALPNKDGSFTCTLFLSEKGSTDSFEQLTTPSAVESFFQKHFPDATPLIENLSKSFFKNPTGHLATVRCHPWNFQDQVLLVGDAAHGIVPFFGQGLNCGFEDCSYLLKALDEHEDLLSLFSDFSEQRKVNTDAIAQLALDNFIEMRDKVSSPRFLLEKDIERELMKRHPRHYYSKYFLVTFSQVPYQLAFEVGKMQDEILNLLSEGKTSLSEVDFELGFKLVKDRLEFHNHRIRGYLK